MDLNVAGSTPVSHPKKVKHSMKNKLNNNNLKLAIQKSGRLTEETLDFLRKSGLEFETYKQQLFSSCRNFPLEILYVRDDDIPNYVESGIVDIGIVGQNILNEKSPKVARLLNLRFGFCSLVLAAPKDTNIATLQGLKNKTIATSYPKSTQKFFKEKNVPIEIVTIRGSVEITPALGVADAIVDLTSSGSTLALNDLIIIEKVFDSEAVLLSNNQPLTNEKNDLLKKLMMRFQGVLSAKEYKYIMMNAPKNILPELKKIIPGLKSPTISALSIEGWVSIQTVIKEDIFWETIEKLKQIGATDIIILPIEKMII